MTCPPTNTSVMTFMKILPNVSVEIMKITSSFTTVISDFRRCVLIQTPCNLIYDQLDLSIAKGNGKTENDRILFVFPTSSFSLFIK